MRENEIPAQILAERQPGETLIPVQTGKGLEWWLFDENGEFVEAFWEDRVQKIPSSRLELGAVIIALAILVMVWAV